MNALITGSASAAAVAAVSPWILPLIAIAAKRKEAEARRGRLLRYWLGRKADARCEARRRARGVIEERMKARREATTWRD